jgi:hypothetical protein
MRRKIGVFRLTEPKEYTNLYETAAWYQRILVEPGDYDVILDATQYPWVLVSLPGIVTKSDFTSLWGGVAFGKPKIDEDKGKESKYVIQMNPYNVADAVANNDPHWILDSDIGIEEKVVDSFLRPGEKITIRRLIVDGKEYS